MTVQMILLPLFIHVALVLAVLLRGIRTAEVTADGVRACFAALLFYTLTALALFTRKADVIFVVLAFVFVALRLVAAFPQVLSPAARMRVSVDVASLAVLALMWGLFALAILLNV